MIEFRVCSDHGGDNGGDSGHDAVRDEGGEKEKRESKEKAVVS